MNLPVGDYKVTTEALGFKIAVIPSITLQTEEAAALNVTLRVGAVTEEVVVTDSVPLINTQDTSVGQIVALNGRQFWQLVALVPGDVHAWRRRKTHRWKLDPLVCGQRADQRHRLHL